MFFGKNYDFIIGIYFSCTTTGCINKVKLDESIAELFGFEVTELDGSVLYYHYVVLPFGTSTAVDIAEKILRPIKVFLHKCSVDQEKIMF